MNNNKENCPICPNHCPADALRCGRGKAYFGEEHSIAKHSNFQHGEAGDKKCRLENSGVIGLLRQSGHFLHHNAGEISNEELCKGLTLEEQKELETLLNKLISSWENK